MSIEEVIFKKENRIAYITINREEALNALKSSIMQRLDELFTELEKDNEVVVVLITGAGQKSFVAGADVKEIQDAGEGRTALITKGQQVFSKIRNSSKIVLAAINGYALGGGLELALACDIRMASENAKFGLPEAKLGLMPGYGGTQILSRVAGIGMAKWMMFTGNMLGAAEAEQCGLVQKVCSLEGLPEEASGIAKKIAANGPFALKAIKRAINRGIELDLDTALRVELEEYDKVAHSQDAVVGMEAFFAKKSPVFTGK
ncbi:MAG TPA: enoyl-CoA hydratase-related protein [Syntrophorhabdales bacterium]|nr:enoyl-CoA hydratase-related protein [Syntrophorhabdales bacterium]